VHERALGRADQLGPAIVDVFTERRRGIRYLPVNGQIDEVFELLLAEAAAHEAHLDRRLLAALGEVLLVERKAQLAVFEDEILARVVVSTARLFHVRRPGNVRAPGSSGSYVRFLHGSAR